MAGSGRLSLFAATLPALAFSARQCREPLQQPVAPEPAGYDPRVAAQMVTGGRPGLADYGRVLIGFAGDAVHPDRVEFLYSPGPF